MSENLRKREPNFGVPEIELLTTLVKKYANVLENKKSDFVNTKLKEETWGKLADDFNSSSGMSHRSTKALRAKYENIKKTLKRKYGEYRRSLYRTGGGPSQDLNLTQEEEVIMELAGTSVEGLPARFDGDTMQECDNKKNIQTQDFAKGDEKILIIDDSDDIETSVLEQHPTNSVATHDTPKTRTSTPQCFLLKRKRSRALSRDPDSFRKTMGNYTELSKKKKTLVDAQIRSVHEKMNQEKIEHDLRCANIKQRSEQEAKEHGLKCKQIMLDIKLKEKALKQ